MSVPSPAHDVWLRPREEIEAALGRLFPEASWQGTRLSSAMYYAVMSPGKRVRPVLALTCARALGVDPERVMAPACALELVHAASLVLDDMPCMDNSPSRRGRPSVHVAYGEGVASLTVVSLLAEAYRLIAEAPGLSAECRVELTASLSHAIGLSGLAGGQEIDLRREAATYAEFDTMHRLKTSALFTAAVDVAACIASASAAQRHALHRFATELGLAFQALDDLADASARGEAEGSNVVTVLGRETTRRTVARSLREARNALRDAGATVAPLADLLDHLFGRVAGG